MFISCRFISAIVIVVVDFVVFITAIAAYAFLAIVIVYSCLLGRIGSQLTECLVVDISILIKLALALVIGFNTNNSSTEKLSSRNILHKPK